MQLQTHSQTISQQTAMKQMRLEMEHMRHNSFATHLHAAAQALEIVAYALAVIIQERVMHMEQETHHPVERIVVVDNK